LRTLEWRSQHAPPNRRATLSDSIRAVRQIHSGDWDVIILRQHPNSESIETRSAQAAVSFPKIISGRIDDAVRPRWEWRQWQQTVGLLGARAHLSLMPSACALDCNMPHSRKEFAAGAPRRRSHSRRNVRRGPESDCSRDGDTTRASGCTLERLTRGVCA
jgi:hypothetical protein